MDWLKTVCWKKISIVLFLVMLFISGGLATRAAVLDVEKMQSLNSLLEEFKRGNLGGSATFRVVKPEIHKVPIPLTILARIEDEKVFMVEATYYDDHWPVGWFPWFDQAEGEPEVVMVDGAIYTQQIYFASPETEFERLPLTLLSYLSRGGSIRLGEEVSLNFYDLKKINPGLEYYETMVSPFPHDGSMVFFSPPGPGLGFLGKENGEIFAVVYLHPKEAGWQRWFFQERGESLYHPDLGELYTVEIVLRDPEGRFNLDEWVMEEEKPDFESDFDGFIEPGFVCKELNMELIHGMVNIRGTMLNQTGENYNLVLFLIKLFDKKGNVVWEGAIPVSNFSDNQTQTIQSMLILEPGADLDEVSYQIVLDSYMK